MAAQELVGEAPWVGDASGGGADASGGGGAASGDAGGGDGGDGDGDGECSGDGDGGSRQLSSGVPASRYIFHFALGTNAAFASQHWHAWVDAEWMTMPSAHSACGIEPCGRCGIENRGWREEADMTASSAEAAQSAAVAAAGRCELPPRQARPTVGHGS